VRCTARKGSASSSKQRELSRQRYAIAAEAIEEGAATVAEIARRLHRSEAAISQLKAKVGIEGNELIRSLRMS